MRLSERCVHSLPVWGWLSEWLWIQAMSLGVDYIHGSYVKPIMSENTSSHGYSVSEVVVQSVSSMETRAISAPWFVNATGPWAGKLVDTLIETAHDRFPQARTHHGGRNHIHRVPVEPRKRCVFVTECHPDSGVLVPPRTTPLTIDLSGVWFRPEGQGKACSTFIMGVSPEESQDPAHTSNEALNTIDYALFDDHVWPVLANRVPAFEYLKLKNAWAGFYEHNTLDQNGIIGRHTDIPNLLLINGFSGHGIQQSPAAGNAIAELILHGQFRNIDLTRLSFERVVNNTPLFETEAAIV